MSLFNNNKKKKDNKAGNQQRNNPAQPAGKGKANTKAVPRNTRLTGGSQRGS